MDPLDDLMRGLRERVEARRDPATDRDPDHPPLGPTASMEEVFHVIRSRAEASRRDAAEARGEGIGLPLEGVPADLDMAFELPALEVSAQVVPRHADLVVRARAPVVEAKPSYALAEFLDQNDVDFVRSAYVGLLRREPDPEGLATHLQALRSGSAKVEVLWALRHSEEGMKQGVPVRGLGWAYRMRRLQGRGLLGYLASQIQAHLGLPRIADRLDRLERDVASGASRLEEAWRSTDHIIASAFAVRDVQLAELRRASTTRQALESMAARLVDTGVGVVQAHEAMLELKARMAAVQHEAVASVLDRLDRAIVALEDAKASSQLASVIAERFETRSQSIEAAIESVSGQVQALGGRVDDAVGVPMPDDFYLSFEDRFRGPLEEIKRRVEVYVPLLAGAGAGMPDRPVVDIGCGRGELLEVLGEHGLHATGVDLNKAMVDECARRRLRAAQGEAVGYLNAMAADSLGGVTGLHIIEHLPFSGLIALFDASYRALKSGGVAIFETPNPENVTVGSCNFWYDPTHRAPLPPILVEWLAASRGFREVQIMRLHANAEQLQTSEGDESARGMLNAKFNGPQDYAVVARKP